MDKHPEILILTAENAPRQTRRYLYVPGVPPAERFMSARYLTESWEAEELTLEVIAVIRNRARKRNAWLPEKEFQRRLKEDAIVF